MLRVWDGVEAGASRQEIASVLFNAELGKLRSIDWKTRPNEGVLPGFMALRRS